MSFRVKAIGRWMHHDISFSLTCRRELSSVRNIRSLDVRTRSTTSPQPPGQAQSSFLPLIFHVRRSSHVATVSTEVQPVEDAPVEKQDEPAATEVQDATRSVRSLRPLLPPKWTSGTLTPHPQAFKIPSLNLPLNEQFVDHPGPFPALPWVFSYLFTRVFSSYCQKKSIDDLRQEFARYINWANHVWKTHHQDSLANWLNYTHGRKVRAREVVYLLVGSVLVSAQQILDVLNMLKPLDGDFALRAHCLYLTGFLYKSELLQDKALLQRYDAEINKLRLTQRWPDTRMSLDHIRMLLWRSDEAQTKSLLSSLRQNYPTMNVWTLLFLTMFCSRKGMPDEAFSFFNRVEPHLLQNPPTQVLARCSLLLQHDYVVHTAAGPNFRYLPTLLEKGLSPDSLLYHRIIERALASDYAGVAWDIYHHLQTLNITIYWRTYHVLLRQAFNSRNVKGVDEIMSQIHQRKDLYTHPSLLMYAMNMVRRIHHTSGKMTASQGLAHMLALYDRAYTRAPLVVFGITSSSEHKATGVDLAEPDIKSVRWLWKRAERLVEDGDKTVLECMKRDLIYNAFIWLHLKHHETIPDALGVFQYMLEKQFCLPTARTWSIMICGLLHLGQRAQAKQVYHLMCEHGFAIDNICEEYVSSKITLNDLEKRIDEVLDDQNMPDGTDLRWAEDVQHLPESQAGIPEQSFGCDVAPGEVLYDMENLGELEDTTSGLVSAQ
ncbi:hypothetical protein LTR70_002053 [Exophiala xenobiotica]|uniref:Pentatricopeptide repeat protein n=1 Tax=Lithohypha guttulata TaxID=1690604 RepID=A0ABR0KCK2_9EURO|nr:hypothetical protein LTR24_004622 [Lithohypha guttulata]KAK5326289.1 hypothetical protein LTR70_002053 [Exophiala xenobiotica]